MSLSAYSEQSRVIVVSKKFSRVIFNVISFCRLNTKTCFSSSFYKSNASLSPFESVKETTNGIGKQFFKSNGGLRLISYASLNSAFSFLIIEYVFPCFKNVALSTGSLVLSALS